MNINEFAAELGKERREWAALEERLKNEEFAARLRKRKEEKVTTIKLHEGTKDRLMRRRAYPTEPFESVIVRLLS